MPEAIEAVHDIFARNAVNFYKINSDLKNPAKPSLNLETSTSLTDVSLIRIIWADTSGQHRCRVGPTLKPS